MSSSDQQRQSGRAPCSVARVTSGTAVTPTIGLRGRLFGVAVEAGGAPTASFVGVRSNGIANTKLILRAPGVANEVVYQTAPAGGVLFEDGLQLNAYPAGYTAVYVYFTVEGATP